MQELGIKPDVYTYSSVANAYAKLGDAESALRLLSDMAKGGVKPNAFTCAAVMQVCYVFHREELLQRRKSASSVFFRGAGLQPPRPLPPPCVQQRVVVILFYLLI